MSYAAASIVSRVIDALKRMYRKQRQNRRLASKLVGFAIRVRSALSREDRVVGFLKAVALGLQRLQSSLEDSLSIQSLLLEILSAISIAVMVIVAWLIR